MLCLHNFVSFAQFKKREQHPWRSVTFNVAGFKPKSNIHSWVIFTFLNCANGTKWCKASQMILTSNPSIVHVWNSIEDIWQCLRYSFAHVRIPELVVHNYPEDFQKIWRKIPVAEAFFKDAGLLPPSSLKRNSNTYYLPGTFVIFFRTADLENILEKHSFFFELFNKGNLLKRWILSNIILKNGQTYI